MKKIILSLLMFLIVGVSQVAAHGGRLDSDGGHYNRKTGKYHTHRGGSNLGKYCTDCNRWYIPLWNVQE